MTLRKSSMSLFVAIFLAQLAFRCRCTRVSTRKLLSMEDDRHRHRIGHYGYKKIEFIKHDYRKSELDKCEATRLVTTTQAVGTPDDVSATSSTLSPLSTPVASSSHLEICSEPCANVADTSGATLDFERTTATGKDTIEVVQEALRHAWRQWDKRSRPVDLFVRTGCRDAGEIRFLFESVELFWPRGIGNVVVVLDEADAAVADKSILPEQTKHSYRVFYERPPCMPGRVFNQVSYLMADHYSSADTIVTIDSDCIFHSPVTPDLLFDEGGSILLPWSAKFQEGLWNEEVEYFTGPGTYVGHSMVSQPVAIHRATLQAYRRWYAEQNRGKCLLDGVASFVDSIGTVVQDFCWMCQINTFIQTTGETADAYELIDVESSASRPYQRLALHVNYERVDGATDGMSVVEFKKSADAAIRQGLCRALGSRLLTSCLGSDVSYVKQHLFSYVGWSWKLDELQRLFTETKYVQSLHKSLLGSGNRRMRS